MTLPNHQGYNLKRSGIDKRKSEKNNSRISDGICKKAELSQKIILELQGSMIDLLNIWKLELVYYCIYAILAVNGFRALSKGGESYVL